MVRSNFKVSILFKVSAFKETVSRSANNTSGSSDSWTKAVSKYGIDFAKIFDHENRISARSNKA
jgi:hypothetical protein